MSAIISSICGAVSASSNSKLIAAMISSGAIWIVSTPFACDEPQAALAMSRMDLISALSAFSPISRLLLSRASSVDVHASTRPIRIDEMPSASGMSKCAASTVPTAAMTMPISAALSSNTHHEQRRILALDEGLRTSRASPLALLNWRTDTSHEQPSNRNDAASTTSLTIAFSIGCGLEHAVHALEDRHARAEREHQQRDDEAPEVQLAAIPRGVVAVGALLGHAHAVQQQHLVAGVDERVHRLAEHRGAAGERGRAGLGHGHQHVADQRGPDRALRAAVARRRDRLSAIYLASSLRARATTLSALKPNSFSSTLAGADAPKWSMPITSPAWPT